MGTLLAFDYGTRKIGVAVGQTLTGTATPLETLQLVNQQPNWARIGHLIDEWRPEALVVVIEMRKVRKQQSETILLCEMQSGIGYPAR